MFDDISWPRLQAKASLAPIASRTQAGSTAGRGYRFYSVGKRLVDIGLVLLSAPIVLPLVGALAAAVMLDGSSPFYFQPRVGRNGRIFQLWKLRSMVPNADRKLAAYLDSCPEARAEWDTAQKLRHDPRLTRIGRHLRRYSLDELPQLWNILIGDMSLVGPRPMLREQRLLYPGTAYFDLRPGLTGMWQISERNNCSFAGRAAYDNRYATSVSASTDFQIMLQTIGVVIRGTGC